MLGEATPNRHQFDWYEGPNIFARSLHAFPFSYQTKPLLEIDSPIRLTRKERNAYTQVVSTVEKITATVYNRDYVIWLLGSRAYPWATEGATLEESLTQLNQIALYRLDTLPGIVHNFEIGYLTFAEIMQRIDQLRVYNYGEGLSQVATLLAFMESPQAYGPASNFSQNTSWKGPWYQAYLTMFARECFPSLFVHNPRMSKEEVQLSETLFYGLKGLIFMGSVPYGKTTPVDAELANIKGNWPEYVSFVHKMLIYYGYRLQEFGKTIVFDHQDVHKQRMGPILYPFDSGKALFKDFAIPKKMG